MAVTDKGLDRAIRCEVVVKASVSEVWEAWTRPEGVASFLAPACSIDLRPGGRYEMYFDPDAQPGKRGGEGVTILAMQPEKMLAFTWNAPPHLPNARAQFTHVTVRFLELDGARTKVTLVHDGWGEGGEWDEAFKYFVRAWNDIVMFRLAHRFVVGPVDWNDPPRKG